jgi:ADP-ribose 1''-phosphate phosphatase
MSKASVKKSDSGSQNGIKLVEEEGDIFAAPPNTVLVHACNCIGSWGAGIALAFKKRYPEAFKLYQRHCKSTSPDELFGSALLIPPCEKTGPSHYVGCVFTSRAFGRNKDSREDILEATDSAMAALLEQIARDGNVENIWMCQINSGLFDVPWKMTKDVIERLEVPLDRLPSEIKVISLPTSSSSS